MSGHRQTHLAPDIPASENRITLERSDWSYQNTVIDYFPVIQNAAMYANANDFDGALERIAEGLDEVLRRVIKPTQINN